MNLQNKLIDIYRSKAEGAFVRSRSRWLEKEEQNTAYFFRLEKFQAKNSTIQKFNIDGNVTDDSREIAQYCSDTKLYDFKYCKELTCQFMDSLTETKLIDAESCDKSLTLGSYICY